ncbi:hypothetical protein [Streptomyces sp. NPDC059247]|uniref:hypothetical protein n=1 Tax=Streptomyces sp. NPDC059247 TaxID=3346790 RepID=UPI0036A53002
MADSTTAPVYAYRSQITPQTAVAWGSEPFETAPGGWVNLPGALIPISLGPSFSLNGGLLVVTFSAEAAVRGPGGIGHADITFGGEPGSPRNENHPLLTAEQPHLTLTARTTGTRTDQVCLTESGGESWSSHTITRARNYPWDAAKVRNAEVKVRLRLEGGEKFLVQNWLVHLTAYPYKDAATT